MPGESHMQWGNVDNVIPLYLLGDRSTAVRIPVEDCKLVWDQHIELDSLQLRWLWFVVSDTQLELLKSDP